MGDVNKEVDMLNMNTRKQSNIPATRLGGMTSAHYSANTAGSVWTPETWVTIPSKTQPLHQDSLIACGLFA